MQIKKYTLFLVSFAILLSLFSFSNYVQAQGDEQKEVDVHIFYGTGCPHCAQALEFFDVAKNKSSNLNVITHEVYFDEEERVLFENLSNAYDTKIDGVPTIFIDEKVFVGFNVAIKKEIDEEIKRCSKNICIDPLSLLTVKSNTKIAKNEQSEIKKNQTLTIPAVISASLVDAINPCAFAVLIILLTTILGSKNKKRALFAGLAFSFSIFISYLLMGLGLYTAIQAAKFTHTFYTTVAILAILIGLFNLKDYLWYGKWFVMEVPMKWRPKLKCLIKSVTSVPGAFLVGFVVSLFLLPCTSGPYIVILGLLAKATTKQYAIFLLILYNFIFVMPMILITLAVYFGLTTTKKAEEWRVKKIKYLHLIAGIIILCLGIGMLVAMKLGII